MKVITEKRLTQLLGEAYAEYEELFIYNLLNTECVELNPWQPIDENTPKDRQVLLHRIIGTINQVWVGYAFDHWPYPPTHWQELPPDPPCLAEHPL